MKQACISKCDFKRKTRAILLMVTFGELWRDIGVTKLSGSLMNVTLDDTGNFYFLNCLNSFRTK